MTRSITQQPRESTAVPIAPTIVETPHRQLILVRQLDRSTWLAESDGETVVAQATAATPLDPAAPSRTAALEALPALIALRAPQLIAVIDVADQDDGSAWLLSEHVDGVSLRRLLNIATLTPVQATYIAIQVLEGLAQLHNAGIGHGRLNAGNIVISRAGQPRLANWALTTLAHTRTADEVRAADLARARLVVGELARNANRPVVWRHGPEEAVLARLEHCGNGGSTAGIPAMTKGLRASIQAALSDDVGMVGARSELASLVSTLSQRVGSGHAPERVESSDPLDELDRSRTSWRHPVRIVPALPARKLSPADWHQPRHRRWVGWLATLVVLGLLAAGAYVFARKPIISVTDRILGKDHAASKSTVPSGTHAAPNPTATKTTRAAPTRRTPLPVPTLAPSTAGSIAGVDLRPFANCTAGASCPARITVRFDPAYNGEEVAWRVSLFNRCTGSTSVLARGRVTGAPGTYVFDSTSVRIPAAKSMAMIATTSAPAQAASPPVLIPSGGGSC